MNKYEKTKESGGTADAVQNTDKIVQNTDKIVQNTDTETVQNTGTAAEAVYTDTKTVTDVSLADVPPAETGGDKKRGDNKRVGKKRNINGDAEIMSAAASGVKNTGGGRSVWKKISDAVFFLPGLINRRLKIKITSKTTAMFSILYLVIAVIMAVIVTENLKINIKANAAEELSLLSGHVESHIIKNGFTGIDGELLSGEEIIIKDMSGNIVAKNTDAGLPDDFSGRYDFSDNLITVKHNFTYGGQVYTVIMRSNIEYAMSANKNAAISFIVTIPIGLIVIIALGSLASAAMLKPIKEMNNTIKSISAESLETRIKADTSQDELNELKDLLNSMLDSLEESFLEQTRFVSDASHELRTPISVIQGYANLLKRWGKSDPKVLDESIEAISKETDNIKNMVENLLFLAKADTLTLKKEKFVLSEILEEIVKETKLIVKDKDIYVDKIMPVESMADRALIKQMIRIFVDNAIKYTEQDGVIRVGCYESDGAAVIRITDNGIGIPAVDLPKVFERFYRCDMSRNRNKGSTGLGLSIAKWIADSHGGEITVTSKEKVGTTVCVSLPIEDEEND